MQRPVWYLPMPAYYTNHDSNQPHLMSQVKERPILFSGAMVRALLDASKTQTRRVIKNIEEDEDLGYLFPKPKHLVQGKDDTGCCFTKNPANSRLLLEICPYGKPGDRLWVRESMIKNLNSGTYWPMADGYTRSISEETGKPFPHEKSVPSIHMPRAASRLLLEITAVRCERLQEISHKDALAEGVWRPTAGLVGMPGYSAVNAYKELWNKINGPESWAANPWVWVVEFKIIDGKEVASA
jgi:hypothetical protein